MNLLNDELRLILTLALNGGLLAGAWRFVTRRWGSAGVWAVLDASLLFLFSQYALVCGLGVVGILFPVTLVIGGILAAAALWLIGGRAAMPALPLPPGEDRRESEPTNLAGRTRPHPVSYAAPAVKPPKALTAATWIITLGTLFVLGYAGTVLFNQRYLPVLSNDPLVYHLPAAVQWLQTGWLGLFETWFYHPANTYSPLAGSTFIAWLIAPLGNDVFARFVQVPAYLVLFFGVLQLCRELGCSTLLSTLVAVALAVSKPLINQVIMPKDDLFLAAFFLLFIVAAAPSRLRESAAPYRLGIAMGLFLATKYTGLMVFPILLLLVDAPFRSGWRVKRWGVFLAAVALIAAPWYLRNGWMTGNPLFPIDVAVGGVVLFEGMMISARSLALRKGGGLREAFLAGYTSLTIWPTVAVAVGWGAGLVLSARRVLADPLMRACFLGPVIGIAVFVFKSPYAESRFLAPVYLLLFAAAGAGLARLPKAVGLGGAALLIVLALITGAPHPRLLRMFLGGGLSLALIGGAGAWLLTHPRVDRRMIRYSAVAAALVLGIAIFVYWTGYLRQYRALSAVSWIRHYGPVGQVWEFAEQNLPPGTTVARGNSYFVYPLQGWGHDRRVVYAPTQRDVEDISDLPRFPRDAPGEMVFTLIRNVTLRDADREQWLRRFRESGAQYLVVQTRDVADLSKPAHPPELEFAESLPKQFHPLYRNDAGVVYRIAWPEGR